MIYQVSGTHAFVDYQYSLSMTQALFLLLYLVVNSFRRSGQSNKYRAVVYLDVACTLARADVYAMVMGSLTDDQIRQPRLCR